jgi:hypothetical protein
MEQSWMLVAATVSLPPLWLLALVLADGYRELRAPRVVLCPKARKPAALEIRTNRLLGSEVARRAWVAVEDCSLWPQQECSRTCLGRLTLPRTSETTIGSFPLR